MNKLIGTKTVAALALMGGMGFAGTAAIADEEADLVINGDLKIVVRTDAPDHLKAAMDTIYSGWVFRSTETQQLEMDDFDNPGMLAVEASREVWNTVDGAEGKSCASCHGDGTESMKGVKAVYPKWNEAAGEVRTLETQINDCRTTRMGAEEWKYGGNETNGMIALISMQSRGMPVDVAIDGPAQSTWEQGKEMYYTRFGQLDLSCANCHEQNYGNYIRADHLSQGQVNGFPAYRLKNTKLNSVHDRFKGCIRDTRAETFSPGSPEFVALELYVTSRGNGLSVESASIRN